MQETLRKIDGNAGEAVKKSWVIRQAEAFFVDPISASPDGFNSFSTPLNETERAERIEAACQRKDDFLDYFFEKYKGSDFWSDFSHVSLQEIMFRWALGEEKWVEDTAQRYFAHQLPSSDLSYPDQLELSAAKSESKAFAKFFLSLSNHEDITSEEVKQMLARWNSPEEIPQSESNPGDSRIDSPE
jgi:hypothetical protein